MVPFQVLLLPHYGPGSFRPAIAFPNDVVWPNWMPTHIRAGTVVL